MQVAKSPFTIGKITTLVVIFLMAFAVTSSLFYRSALAQMPGAPIMCSMLFAWISILSVTGMISWLIVIVYFIKMVSSPKQAAFLGDAPPLNALYVFSNKYLGEEGAFARRRLCIGVIVGMSAFIGVVAAIFLLRFFYQS